MSLFTLYSTKTPLKWFGGKTSARNAITAHIPAGTDRIVSPFIGGGSLEVLWASKGIRVVAGDIWEPLVNFWRVLMDRPAELAAKILDSNHPPSREMYDALAGAFEGMGSLDQAAAFYTINKLSFMGKMFGGYVGDTEGYARPNGNVRGYGESIIGKDILQFSAPNLSVECADYRDLLDRNHGTLAYLDPPYIKHSTYYGTKKDQKAEFNHAELADYLRGRTNWLMSNQDCPEVRDLYPDCEFLPLQFSYGRGKSKEVLIRG